MKPPGFPRQRPTKILAGGVAAGHSALQAFSNNTVQIDSSRQLFVDDYLLAQTSLHRTFHKPRIHESSTILKPETPLEMNNGYCPVACPFQDGVFYDSKDKLYKIWIKPAGLMERLMPIGRVLISKRAQIACSPDAIHSSGMAVAYGWITRPQSRGTLQAFRYHRKHDAGQFQYAQLHPGL